MDSSLIDQAKAVDLLALIGRDARLSRQAATHGGEWAGPCPLCGGGQDRLRVWPNHEVGYGKWWCRVCTQGGDAIQYLRLRDHASFLEAVQILAGAELPRTRSETPALASDVGTEPHGRPPAEWQAAARRILDQATAALWGADGERAHAWLKARGLSDDTLRAAQLGYIPAGQREPAERWGLDGKPVWLPRGILIPCEAGEALWYLKVRQPAGKPKYLQARGGRPALYWAESLAGHEAAVFCEGEFDTLLLWQEVGDLAGTVTLGSAANRLDMATWGLYLLPTSQRLLAYDLDPAGEKGAAALGWLKGARRLNVPLLKAGAKDLTDFHASGGNLRTWLKNELRPSLHENTVQFSVERVSAHCCEALTIAQRHPAYIPSLPICRQPLAVEEAWWAAVFAERGIPDPAQCE